MTAPNTSTNLPAPVRTSAFTLTELAVAVSITTVVVSLFLPALGHARNTARTAVCASNARQMVFALNMYTRDNRGWIFPMSVVEPGVGTHWWFGFEAVGGPTAEGERILDRTQGRLWPYYTVTDSIEVCPSFPLESTHYKPKFTTNWTTYGLPQKMISPAAPVTVARITKPSETLAFADSAQINTFQAPASPTNPMFEQWYYVSKLAQSVHYVHDHRANFAMFDGHVETLDAQPDLNLTFPEAPIGKPPPDLILEVP